jgi:hypothetical protein
MRILFALAVVALASPGCVRHWNLKLTEVGKRRVEMFMAEDPAKSLALDGAVLSWTGHGGHGDRVDLGALGRRLAGGEFLIVWEESGYPGPPVAQDFVGGLQTVPGIKVREGFFAMVDAVPGEILVAGDRLQVAVLTTHKVNDVVRFGIPVADRPATGGTFRSDGSLPNPTGSASPQRRWGASGPQDQDEETDWIWGVSSWGVRTP